MPPVPQLTASQRRHLDTLKQQLRATRKDKGLTGRDLSDRLGIALPTIRNWETGSQLPLMRNCFLWAAALGLEFFVEDTRDARQQFRTPPQQDESLEKREMRRLGHALKLARVDLRMTQSEVAEKVGVNALTLGTWERAYTYPYIAALLVWAGAVGCSIKLRQANQSVPAPTSPTPLRVGDTHPPGTNIVITSIFSNPQPARDGDTGIEGTGVWAHVDGSPYFLIFAPRAEQELVRRFGL